MSDWKKRFTEVGKFRDAEFFASSSTILGGRRNVVHEFPLQDDPFIEDFGLKAKTFSLLMIVIGADYMTARDKLIDALDGYGAGTLVHPWYGSKSVVVLDYQVSETTDKGGMAEFTVNFSLSGGIALPVASVDTAKAVELSANEALAQAEMDFAKTFSIENLTGYATAQLEEFMGDVLPAITDVIDTAQTVYEFADNVRKDIASFQQKITAFIRAPALFANKFISLAGSFTSLVSNPLSAFDIYTRLFGLGGSSSSSSTATLYPTIANKSMIQRGHIAKLIRQSAVINAAKISATVQFETKNQALDMRNQLVELLDNIALDASDQQYQVLATLQAAVNTDLTIRGAQLPALRLHTLKMSMPAVVAAHRIYYDATMDAEIVTRNNIRHPGFVLAGILEVLNG